MRKGIVIVMSGPSGAGKSTLSQRLLKEFNQTEFSISCTSRKPRSGEVNGRDYYFISRSEFDIQRKAGAFAEWAVVHNNFYGTPLAAVNKALKSGHDVLLDIDVQGAAQLKINIPTAAFVFILPPSLKTLEERLRSRGLDNEAIIRQRLTKARAEINQAGWYDGVIVNDDLETAYSQLKSFYIAATLAPYNHQAVLSEFRDEEFGDLSE